MGRVPFKLGALPRRTYCACLWRKFPDVLCATWRHFLIDVKFKNLSREGRPYFTQQYACCVKLGLVYKSVTKRLETIVAATYRTRKSFEDRRNSSLAYPTRNFDDECPQRRSRYCILRSGSVKLLHLPDLLSISWKLILWISSKDRNRDTLAYPFWGSGL